VAMAPFAGQDAQVAVEQSVDALLAAADDTAGPELDVGQGADGQLLGGGHALHGAVVPVDAQQGQAAGGVGPGDQTSQEFGMVEQDVAAAGFGGDVVLGALCHEVAGVDEDGVPVHVSPVVEGEKKGPRKGSWPCGHHQGRPPDPGSSTGDGRWTAAAGRAGSLGRERRAPRLRSSTDLGWTSESVRSLSLLAFLGVAGCDCCQRRGELLDPP